MTTPDANPATRIWTLTAEVFISVDRVADFRRAFAEVNAECIAISGLLGQGADSAPESHGAQPWVFTYKYTTEAARAACRASLQSAFASMADLMTTTPSITTYERAGARRPVEVVTAQVSPKQLDAYSILRDEMDAVIARAPGFVSLDTFPPADGGNTWVTSIMFATDKDLEAWQTSAERARMTTKLATLAKDDVRTIPTGFGQWFSVNALAMVQTPAWKQDMTVLAVLFAMVSVLNITIGDAFGQGWTIDGTPIYKGLGLPLPVVVFICTAIGTALLTWVLMPIVTRLFAWWLDPGATRQRTIQGVVLLMVIYAIEITIFTAIFTTLGI